MKKSRIKGFAPVSIRLEEGPVENSGEPHSKPLELRKTVLRTSGSDESSQDDVPLAVTKIQKRTVQGLSFTGPKIPETASGEDDRERDGRDFEWGRPLLGGSSDEEDYGDEDGARFNKVSINLQGHSSESRIAEPDQEVIEAYIDDKGRHVKRISKVTTTRTITRVEREASADLLTINVPVEPSEDVEEYIDEHGRQVRRVVRTSIPDSTKTELRDGAVKLVLIPGDSGEQDVEEPPEDTERIQLLTTPHGRVQKLTKTTFTTQLKGSSQGATEEIMPFQVGKPTDHTSGEYRLSENVTRDVSYPEWLESVRDSPPTSIELSMSSIQIEPHQLQLPTEKATEEPHIIEDVVPHIIEKQPLVIPLKAFGADEGSPWYREHKRVEPSAGGLPESPVTPGRKLQEEIPLATANKSGVPRHEPQGKIFESAEPVHLQTDHDDDVAPSVQIRKVILPQWMVERQSAPEGERPRDEDSWVFLASEPRGRERKKEFQREPHEVREKVVATTLNREVVMPEIDDMEDSVEEIKGFDDESGVLVRQITKRNITAETIKREGKQTEPMDVEFPLMQKPVYPPEEAVEYVDENGVRVRRIVTRTLKARSLPTADEQPAVPVYQNTHSDVVPSVKTRTVNLPEWMVESVPTTKEVKAPAPGEGSGFILPSEPTRPPTVEKFENQARTIEESVCATTLNREIRVPEMEETDDKSPVETDEYVKQRIETIVIRSAPVGQSSDPERKRFESTAPVFLETQREDFIPSVKTREVVFPEWMAESEPKPTEEEKLRHSTSIILPFETKRPTPPTDIVRESVTAITVNREISIPEIRAPGEKEDYVDETGDPARRIVKRNIPILVDGDETMVFHSEDVVSSEKTRNVSLPGWMVESVPTPQEDKPKDPISWLVLSSEPKQPEYKELGKEGVEESVPATTLNRDIVIPEIKDTEDKSTEEVEECVDEDGVTVRKIVKRMIMTKTKIVPTEGQQFEPKGVSLPAPQTQVGEQGEVEEYVDENGSRVKRIVKRTISTTSVVRTRVDYQGEPGANVSETQMVSENVLPSVQSREVVMPEWMVDRDPTPPEEKSRDGISSLLLRSEPKEQEHAELSMEMVSENVASTTLHREIDIPEVEDMEDKSAEGDDDERVKRIVKRTVTTRVINGERKQVEPKELQLPMTPSQIESPDKVEKYLDENGVLVKRTVKRTITTRSVIHTSVDEPIDESQIKFFESTSPVYVESDLESVVPSVQNRDVSLPEWMVESIPTPKEEKPHDPTSWLILSSERKQPEYQELDKGRVEESVSATALKKEIVFPEIKDTEDNSTEDVDEYVDDHGERVKRIVKRTITTRSIKEEGKQVEPIEVRLPVPQSQIELPEQVEEYLDESGVLVKRTVTRTITTRSVVDTSVDEPTDESAIKVFETTSPVYVESDLESVVPSVQNRDVSLPEWMVESIPTPEEEKPHDPTSWLILSSERKQPEYEELDKGRVEESVSATALKKEIVFPEIKDTEGKSTEEVEEYVDENGEGVRRIVKRTITTRSIKEEKQVGPIEVSLPVTQSQIESPEEVEEYLDENGVLVKRTVKRTITTRSVIHTSLDEPIDESQIKVFDSTFPVYVESDLETVVPSVQNQDVSLPEWMVESIPIPEEEKPHDPTSLLILSSERKEPEHEELDKGIIDESVDATALTKEIVFPEIKNTEEKSRKEIEEYDDENGEGVKRIVKRTITTKSINEEEKQVEPIELRLPVTQSQIETPDKVEEYLDENGVLVKRTVKRTITTRSVVQTSVDEPTDDSQMKVFVSTSPAYLESDFDSVAPSMQTRDVSLPEWMVESIPTPKEGKPHDPTSWLILLSEPKQPEYEEVDKGRVEESVAATTLNREIVFPEIKDTGDKATEDVNEYFEEKGEGVKRIVKRTIATRSIREAKRVEPVEVRLPVTQSQIESPEQVGEYLDENGVLVKRTVKRTITTRSVIHTSVDEPIDESQIKVFESTFPAYVESDLESVVPSVQNRDVSLPEWMVESIPIPEEEKPHDPTSLLILSSERKQPGYEELDKGRVEESIAATALKKEIVFPEIKDTGDKTTDEVQGYVDENGGVRRIVKRTITTRSINGEGKQVEPVEVRLPVTQSQIESPEEVEEYLDENGVLVKRTVKRTITTRSVIHTSVDEPIDESQIKVFESTSPVYLESDLESVVPSVQNRDVSLPEWMVDSIPTPKEEKPHDPTSWLILSSERKQPEHEELDKGIVEESVAATALKKEIVFPEIKDTEDNSTEDVDEYVDDHGERVKRIVKRTITTRSIKGEGKQVEPLEVRLPVTQSQIESPEKVEEYVDENGVLVKRTVTRTITTRSVVRTLVDEPRDDSQMKVFVSTSPVYLETNLDTVASSMQTRDVSLPEWMVENIPTPEEEKPRDPTSLLILSSERKQPEYEELGKGRVEESVAATALKKEIVFPEIKDTGDKSTEEVEECVDENGGVKRIVKRTITTRSIKGERQQVKPVEVRLPVTQSQIESPENFEEYLDENGVLVKRTVKRTITTRSVIHTCVEESTGESKRKAFESAVPVYLEADFESVVPSVQTREVVLPEWMVESGSTLEEQEKPRESITLLFLPSEAKQLDPGECDDGVVSESLVASTLSREIVVPEIDVKKEELLEEDEVAKRFVPFGAKATGQQGSDAQNSVIHSGVRVDMTTMVKEETPRAEIVRLETIVPEAVLSEPVAQLSPRRSSVLLGTSSVHRYLVIIETLYQNVLEHKSMIFTYSSRHMQFNFVLENFLNWLLVTLKTLSWMSPLSWYLSEIQEQLQQIKVLMSHGTS